MRHHGMRVLLLIAACFALVVGVAACGGDDNKSSGGGGGGGGGGGAFGAIADKQDTSGKPGGTLTVLNASDVDSMDPAIAYYQFSYNIMFVTHKTLYQFAPDQVTEPTPDLADGQPQISDDGLTVTVKIKQGVKFSPPVDREVKAADVKYAIERGFNKNVPAPYAGAYFGFIEGAPAEPAAPGTEIPGITTPDDYTIQFKLSKPLARTLTGAMVLPLTAPVPKEYAEKFDKESPSTYADNSVFTGPYMVENDSKGKLVGYEPKKRIHLVRNPNWDKSKDHRPAYLDEIDVREGNEDTVTASRRVLKGKSLMTGDYAVPPDVLREAAQRYKEQVKLAPSGGNRYISLNTSKPPFDDPNVRKAVIAGFDRDALRLTRGGPAIGDVPTHFIPPEVPGYEEAGGKDGFGIDYLSKEKGDPALSAKYFKAAGMASGKYEGKDEIVVAGDADDPGNKTALVAVDQFKKLGFNVKPQYVQHEDLVTEVCGQPKTNPNVCVNTGWLKDFNDAQTMLELTFKGKEIKPQNNNNYPELNVPEIDKAMDDAATLTDQAERNKAWAKVDQMIMEQAPVVPYVWDKQAIAHSADVKGVVSKFIAVYDFAYTSLK
jgi:peptide/nickel transport system substrate-binding protein